MKTLKRIGIYLLVVLILLSIGISVFLLSLKPVYNGTKKISGLHKSVTIYFDKYGIPHIYGSDEEDVFRALGYIEAEERLFQMELLRRASSGRLSEIFGNKTSEIDKFFRMIGFEQHAEQAADDLMNHKDEPYAKAALAYIDGINQFLLKRHTNAEFLLLKIPKQEFTAKDLFLIIDYMSYDFQMAFRTDPLLSKIGLQHGGNYLKDIGIDVTRFLKDSTLTENNILNAGKHGTQNEQLNFSTPICDLIDETLPVKLWSGSNSFVIAGNKSKSGKPLLENDTHIGIQQPATWYEAYLDCPDFQFYGNFLAGFPFAPVGHTLHHGWGLTIFENDDLDFFAEDVNPKDSTLIIHCDEWEKIKYRKEIIHVKDSADITLWCRSTSHGPICSDVMEDFKTITSKPVSACWTFLNFPNNLLSVTYNLAHAKNINSFRQTVSQIAAPGLNITYVDTANNIAWWSAAKLIERHESTNSFLILDGKGDDDWLGYNDFSFNPQIENPSSGVISNANQDPLASTGIIYPGYYLPNDRITRLKQLLIESDIADRNTLEHINIDVINPAAAEITQTLLSQISPGEILQSPTHQRAIEILNYWNGEHQLTDLAPAVYYKWIYYTLKYSMQDELGEKDFNSFLETHLEKVMLKNFVANDTSAWWDDISTKNLKENRKMIITKAFNKTIDDLEKQLGPDPDNWAWRKVHTVEFKHALGSVKPLDKIFNVGPYNMPGGIETVNNQSFHLDSTGLYKVNVAPAIRRSLDMGDPENTYNVLPTGQSGNVMSNHYSDQSVLYTSGMVRKEMMNRKEISEKCINKLILLPE